VAAGQKRLPPSLLCDEIPFLPAQTGGENLASHFALGLAASPGLTIERPGEIGVDAKGQLD